MDLFPFIALFLSVLVPTFYRGFYSPAGLTTLISLFFILLINFNRRIEKEKLSGDTGLSLLRFAFISVYFLSLFFSDSIYQTDAVAAAILTVIPLLLVPVVVSFARPQAEYSGSTARRRFVFLLAAALILRILVIIASPKPAIDVFVMLREGPLAALSLKNPYNVPYSQVYPGVRGNYFTYWPFSFLIQIPFIFFFGDPRVLFSLADIGTALLIYFWGRKKEPAVLLALIYLFRPNALFIIEQSWLAPLASFFVILTFYFWEKRKNRGILTGLALAGITGLQPYYGILLPFLIRGNKGKENIKLLFTFILTLSLIVLPFYFWNPAEFLDQTFGFYFRNAGNLPSVPMYLSLNFNTLYFSLFRKDLPFIVSFAFMASVLIYVLAVVNRYQRAALRLLGLGLVFLNFYMFNRFAFINYYYFVSGIIIFWLNDLLSA